MYLFSLKLSKGIKIDKEASKKKFSDAHKKLHLLEIGASLNVIDLIK